MKNLSAALDLFCKSEISDFENSELYSELVKLTKSLNYTFEIKSGILKNNDKTHDHYFSVSVLDQKGDCIEMIEDDDGFLTAYTALIRVDKIGRHAFYPWRDDEFYDDIKWMIKCLKKRKIREIFSVWGNKLTAAIRPDNPHEMD